ncbi:ABC transporter substrate-binding protein [Nocardia speluncae]|uniref:ABC transporter substrate-binding protein n=1 Tax=Nocardia speluncae TaxID=419477 RepID=A0A846XJA8_9NOCA|nr:ABC transporter substrate-binding protein [Nocardia speluncae]NKY35425.1 ABC transporter substrate-binding protein [Nocardia speluncae]
MPVSPAVRTPAARKPRNSTRARRAHRFVGAALACIAVAVAGCASQPDNSASIVRTTTKIAGAGVVGTERDTTQACPLPAPADPADGPTRAVRHASGESRVPADPQRIVVLGTSALDATCAVGLWERVVGATTVPGPAPQPGYLGYGVLEVPGVGVATDPDPALIAQLDPDLIIGEVPAGRGNYAALSDIAPTVLVGTDKTWEEQFSAFAGAMGRATFGREALDDYRTEAADTGKSINAAFTEASLVRFTATGSEIMGSETFASQVLADTGAQRPAAQRDESEPLDESDPVAAEGDLIYVMFAGPEGQEHGESVMRSSEWKELGAATDGRTFVVDDALWHTTGLTSARAVLTDIQDSLNSYVME